jgi:uncharacterized protein (DUF2236 family)
MMSMAEIAPESVLLAGAGRAILLQIAHPAIGYGVARHSDFANRPMDRLHGTLSYVYALSSGSEADLRAVQRAVNRAHAPVSNPPRAVHRTAAETPAPDAAGDPPRGSVAASIASESAAGAPHDAVTAVSDAGGDPAYDARDPRLQLWVAATLYDTATTVYELIHGPLDEESADRVYREYALLGTALQMPAELWPVDRAAFRRYFDDQVAALSVDDTVRGVAASLLKAEKAPLPIRLGMPVARFVTVALLPPRIRRAFGFTWSPRQERRFRRLVRVAAPVYRILPATLRHTPHRHYLAKLRAATT